MAHWAPQVLGDLLTRNAELDPQQEALVVGGRRVTYAQLSDEVAAVAQGLRALGVERGDHVALCMSNTIEWAVFFYAAATIGAITVPVNTRFKADELAYCLHQADVTLLLTEDRFLNVDFISMLREICPALDSQLPDPALPLLRNVVVVGSGVPAAALRLSEMLALGTTWDEPHFDEVTPGDVLLMQFTSGTTSYPKGVMLTHENMLRNAACVAERFDLRRGDRYYSARPFYHVAGTTLSLLASLAASACLLSAPSFDAGEALRIMSVERCTHTSGNDTLFLMMLNHPGFDARKLALRGGWASAGPEVSRQIVARMGMKGLCHAYGLSEASPNVCMSWHHDDLEKRINGWGHVLEDLDVAICDPETHKDLAPGTVGEILVRGWSVMRGYYKMPEQTAKAIDHEGWLHTGDLGVMDEEGRLRFVARLKDVFRVGGENVAPAEVEDVLQTHPAIKQAQVIGVPDPRLIEVPAAYIVLKDDGKATAEEIVAWCKSRMANFRVPRYVRIVASFDNIGMTGSAKVQKNKLREQALIDFGLAGKILRFTGSQMENLSEKSPLGTYLEHLKKGELAYQVTQDGKAVFYPRAVAPETGGTLQWRVSKGLGTVYSTTVVHYKNEAPLNVALVDMDEGFRLMSRVEEIDPMQVKIGMRVKFRTHPGDDKQLPYPVFTPAEQQK